MLCGNDYFTAVHLMNIVAGTVRLLFIGKGVGGSPRGNFCLGNNLSIEKFMVSPEHDGSISIVVDYSSKRSLFGSLNKDTSSF